MNLDHLSQSFLSELERVVPSGGFHTEFTDRLIVTIPARSAEVGALTIWLDGDEITVGIGEIHHTHFMVDCEPGETLEAREIATAVATANYIADVLADRVRFQLQFEKGRCRVALTWYPGLTQPPHRVTGADEFRNYVWSGRIAVDD